MTLEVRHPGPAGMVDRMGVMMRRRPVWSVVAAPLVPPENRRGVYVVYAVRAFSKTGAENCARRRARISWPHADAFFIEVRGVMR